MRPDAAEADFGQTDAAEKHILADLEDTAWDGEAIQAGASGKRFAANSNDTAGDGNVRQTDAAAKRFLTDFGNAVGDDNVSARAGVLCQDTVFYLKIAARRRGGGAAPREPACWRRQGGRAF